MRKAKRDEMLQSERQKLGALLVAFLDQHGGKLERAVVSSDNSTTYYDYVLDTPLGTLSVHFTSNDIHLHCRFADVAHAVVTMGESINPYTGKYNTYAFGRRTAAQAMDQVFVPHLAYIWHKAQLTPPWKMAAAVAAV